MRLIATMLVLMTFAVHVATADVIVLLNGKRIEGTLYDVESIRTAPELLDTVRIERADNVIPIQADRIAWVVIGDSESSGEKILFQQVGTETADASADSSGSLSWLECNDLGKRDGGSL